MAIENNIDLSMGFIFQKHRYPWVQDPCITGLSLLILNNH